MGKRSNFIRIERDFYPTPLAAVEPLISHLPCRGFTYMEPCAGDGRLVNHISELTRYSGLCLHKSDLEPQSPGIEKCDALNLPVYEDMDFCITNPPWERKFLHSFIEWYSSRLPTWLLFDADWMHTKQSTKYMAWCKRIVSVGRVKWIEGSKSSGKDNCCWYLFDHRHTAKTEFYGR